MKEALNFKNISMLQSTCPSTTHRDAKSDVRMADVDRPETLTPCQLDSMPRTAYNPMMIFESTLWMYVDLSQRKQCQLGCFSNSCCSLRLIVGVSMK